MPKTSQKNGDIMHLKLLDMKHPVKCSHCHREWAKWRATFHLEDGKVIQVLCHCCANLPSVVILDKTLKGGNNV